LRASSGAGRAALKSVLVEVDRAEVFAVTTELPLQFDRSYGLTLQVNLAENVTSVFTLNGTLPRGEKSSFVFGAEYSHFCSSLQ
jgi:hypothetical protein